MLERDAAGHIDEGSIHAWIDGALNERESAEVEAHIAECTECRDSAAEARGLVAASSRILSALDSAPAGVVPGASVASIDAIRRAARARRSSRWLTSAPLAAAIAAVFIGVIVLRNGAAIPSSIATARTVALTQVDTTHAAVAMTPSPQSVAKAAPLTIPSSEPQRPVARAAPNHPPIASRGATESADAATTAGSANAAAAPSANAAPAPAPPAAQAAPMMSRSREAVAGSAAKAAAANVAEPPNDSAADAIAQRASRLQLSDVVVTSVAPKPVAIDSVPAVSGAVILSSAVSHDSTGTRRTTIYRTESGSRVTLTQSRQSQARAAPQPADSATVHGMSWIGRDGVRYVLSGGTSEAELRAIRAAIERH